MSGCAYQVQNVAQSVEPADPELERRFWYQYYFHTGRGRAGLAAHRGALCRLLRRLWSPTWAFDEATYLRTAASFENPDFVDVVIHLYRHRFGNAPGDPCYQATAGSLAAMPTIIVPTVALQGAVDGVIPARLSEAHDKYFTGRYERRLLDDVGHNLPQEAPQAFARAILDVMEE